MDIWQTASPDQPINTGWIGRWLDATGDDPVRAVNIGSMLPPLAVGRASAAASLDVGRTSALPADLRRRAHRAGGAESGRLGTVPARPRRRTATSARVAATFGQHPRPDTARNRPTTRRPRRRPAGRTTSRAQLDLVGTLRQGRRADARSTRQPRRLRHPRRREGHPADAAGDRSTRRCRVPRRHGRRPARAQRRVAGVLRVRPAGRGQRLATAPTTGRPGRCSSPASRSRAASTASSRR